MGMDDMKLIPVDQVRELLDIAFPDLAEHGNAVQFRSITEARLDLIANSRILVHRGLLARADYLEDLNALDKRHLVMLIDVMLDAQKPYTEEDYIADITCED